MDAPRDDIVNDGIGRLHPQRIEATRRLQTQQGHDTDVGNACAFFVTRKQQRCTCVFDADG